MSRPELFDLRGKQVYVAGHNGMAGSALVRRLSGEGCEIVTAERKALDLTDQAQTERWLAANKPDAVFLAAGHVGGIYANDTYPADFIADNLAIGLNVIRGSFRAGVKKLLALGSSCIYPEARAAADDGRRAAHRPARADQRVVRRRQDCRDQAVRGLPQAARRRFYLGDADQSLRPRRQLSPRQQPRAGCAHPPLP